MVCFSYSTCEAVTSHRASQITVFNLIDFVVQAVFPILCLCLMVHFMVISLVPKIAISLSR